MFVTFEGVDWSGKSTQAELLAAWLREQGRRVTVSREPGGTELAESVRELVLHRGHMSPWAEAALYAAARADNAAQVIATWTRRSPTRAARAGSAPGRCAT
jgi:dTMP kinase